LQQYSPQYIYNADEKSLYYTLLPNRTITGRNDLSTGGKGTKERLTVLLCASSDGSNKMKRLLFGSHISLLLQGHKILLCPYKSNREAWMISQLFIQWLKAFDTKMGTQT
jgi:hypothetical protein